MDGMNMNMTASPAHIPNPPGHVHAPGNHLSYECDGTHWTGMGWQRPSNWSTHTMAGVLVSLWALHWTVSVLKLWFQSSKQRPYQAQTTYKLPFIPESWPVEGAAKALFAFIGIMVQLWWAHGHWSNNICPSGTLRAGHFSITAVHNWQNAWTLFAYMVAGVADIVASRLELPTNMQHFVTASAFGLQAYGLYLDEFQDMLDGMVYYIMFMLTFATAATMFIEMVVPHDFWPGCLKIYTLWLQAIWYLCAARFLHEGRPAWDSLQPAPDMAPAGLVPVMFVMWMNILALTLLTVYLSMRWWFAAHLNEHLRASSGVERTPLGVRGSHTPTHEMVPLVGRA